MSGRSASQASSVSPPPMRGASVTVVGRGTRSNPYVAHSTPPPRVSSQDNRSLSSSPSLSPDVSPGLFYAAEPPTSYATFPPHQQSISSGLVSVQQSISQPPPPPQLLQHSASPARQSSAVLQSRWEGPSSSQPLPLVAPKALKPLHSSVDDALRVMMQL